MSTYRSRTPIWRKVSAEDQDRFLIEMLTPAQRHLIAEGLPPEDSGEGE